jgi:hypothetical protein
MVSQSLARARTITVYHLFKIGYLSEMFNLMISIAEGRSNTAQGRNFLAK